jgi:DNA-binding NtrC family response regulator
MKLVGQPSPGDDERAPHALVVEDCFDLGALLARHLRARGVPTLQVQNARAAILALEARPVSLVISDLDMPERDGLSLLGEVGRRWPKLGRVLWTGHANSDLILNGRGLRVLSKNLDLSLVVDTLVSLHRSFAV